jgi:hypothetical protein
MSWAPSVVPQHAEQTVYLVLDDFGDNGAAFRETDPNQADLETTIENLIEGQYRRPVRVIAFNTAEGWSEDVSHDVAAEIQLRADLELADVPEPAQAFVDRHHPPQCRKAQIGQPR